jgi:hypothetical protein
MSRVEPKNRPKSAPQGRRPQATPGKAEGGISLAPLGMTPGYLTAQAVCHQHVHPPHICYRH